MDMTSGHHALQYLQSFRSVLALINVLILQSTMEEYIVGCHMMTK